jgi:biotin carboxylase
MLDTTERFLVIASYEKGQDFLRQCAEMGIKSTLLTLDKLRDGDWPREALEELVTMPSGLNREQILNTVSWMARSRRFDRIVALDEFDLEMAAEIREHMRVPGMGVTTARCYRDKLGMRVIARAMGFRGIEFCRVLNHDELSDFMERVQAPWKLKPREEASGLDTGRMATRRVDEPEQLWRILEDLGDAQSHYLLEQHVPGDIFQVDSIVSEGEVKFQAVHQCGRSAMQVMRDGGVFTTRTVDRDSNEHGELAALNASLAPMLGMLRGVTHAEFIRAHADGRFYFLEIGARVGGAFIAGLVEAATGVNLWREWARLEVSNLRGEAYVLPEPFEAYAGSVLCLSPDAEPDTAGFDAPEIVSRFKKHHQAGLIVRSSRPERVGELLDEYSAEFTRRLLDSLPPESLIPA